MKLFSVYDANLDENLEIYLGENSRDNWDIIDISSQNDMWFHLDNVPSPHVILKITNNKKKINKQTIIYCCSLCKENSKYCNHKKITAIYTEIKNISKGKEIGSVFTKKIKKIKI